MFSLYSIQKTSSMCTGKPFQPSALTVQKSRINAVSFSIIKHPLQGAKPTSNFREFSTNRNSKNNPNEVKSRLFNLKPVGSSSNISYGFPVPGHQQPTAQDVMNHRFFVSELEWKRVREEMKFDYIVIGSSFSALGFVEKMLNNNPYASILMLERGPFFLPDHFQNLPVPYQQTLGGLSETFPWTLSEKTWNGKSIKWLRGSIPFFGGRSIMWSAWCPRPTEEEMAGWPKQIIAAANRHFGNAEKLLNVVPVGEIDKGEHHLSKKRPIFGVLQANLISWLQTNLHKIPSATRVMAAPLAVSAREEKYTDFVKFSTPSPLLKLIDRQYLLATSGEGSEIKIATECIVQRVLEQNGQAIALETSRGVVSIGNAKLILAMGTLPATTLVLNSFPQVQKAGKSFTGHFISSIIARVPRKDYGFAKKLAELEMAAIYLAGCDTEKGQYHIQLTALSDRDPENNASTASRHMPDIVATATLEQLKESKDYIVFVCAVLGEIKKENKDNWFRHNEGSDVTTNSTLQVIESQSDALTWDTMDEGSFQTLERVLSPHGASHVEYWHPNLSAEGGSWQKGARPQRDQIRTPALVHEGSTMPIGDDENAVVDLNYRLKGTKNVYVTGNSLSPRSGSWNPTLTIVALSQDLADQLSTMK